VKPVTSRYTDYAIRPNREVSEINMTDEKMAQCKEGLENLMGSVILLMICLVLKYTEAHLHNSHAKR
jgi:hypothetical protein